MISTVNGNFQPTSSPFMQRPWTFGYAGIDVNYSRDGRTVMINTTPTANVEVSNFTYVP